MLFEYKLTLLDWIGTAILEELGVSFSTNVGKVFGFCSYRGRVENYYDYRCLCLSCQGNYFCGLSSVLHCYKCCLDY